MICTKKSFSVLACVCLVAQASAITPRTSTNDLQPKNAKTKITRAAEFAQKNAVYGAATAYALATAISAKEQKRPVAAAILTKDFVKTGCSCRGWTVANGLAKCLQNRLNFLKKRAQVYNFLRDLGKEFLGSGLNEIFFILALEKYFDSEDAFKDLFMEDAPFIDVFRDLSFDAFKTIAASKSDEPLNRALLIDLSVHALPNTVAKYAEHLQKIALANKTYIENVNETNSSAKDNFVRWLFNQKKLQKIGGVYSSFCKEFSYKETVKSLVFKLIQKTFEKSMVEHCNSYCDRYTKNKHKAVKKLISHFVKSLVKISSNYFIWQRISNNLTPRLNKIQVKCKSLFKRHSP